MTLVYAHASTDEGSHAAADSRVVLHYRTGFLPRTETFIARQIEGLERAGQFIPFVLCRRLLPGNPPARARVICLEGTDPESSVYPAGRMRPGLMARRMRRVLGWPPARPRIPPEVLSLIETTGPSLIHAHFGDGGWDMVPLARRLGLPLVVTFYGYDASQMARRRDWRRAYLELFRQADLCLGEGSRLLGRLRELGCPPEKLRRVRNLIAVAGVPFRERQWKDARVETVRLLFVGRLVEKKGLSDALCALARVSREFPKLTLDVIGDGPLRSRIEREILDLGLGAVVRLHGMLPYPEVVRITGQADILVVPSCTAADGDSEGGAPNILLDGQAAGLPVVATTHDDIPEFVVPGLSALLAPERDPEALAACLRRLLERRHEWGRMGRAGRAHVESHFDAPIIIEELHQIYDSLSGRRP